VAREVVLCDEGARVGRGLFFVLLDDGEEREEDISPENIGDRVNDSEESCSASILGECES